MATQKKATSKKGKTKKRFVRNLPKKTKLSDEAANIVKGGVKVAMRD